jgi:hypothetical protein
MYQVSTLNDTQEFKNRDRAIETARELSEGNRRQVEVEGRGELLVYVQGDLKTYRFRAN